MLSAILKCPVQYEYFEMISAVQFWARLSWTCMAAESTAWFPAHSVTLNEPFALSFNFQSLVISCLKPHQRDKLVRNHAIKAFLTQFYGILPIPHQINVTWI